MRISIHPDVERALEAGSPVVALESTIIAHGLPRPRNLDLARRVEAQVRNAGAVPATVAVLGGQAHVGLSARQIERIATTDMAKLSTRDLPVAAALSLDGATTVAATAVLAHRAGIAVFATGGLGGVHRDADRTWDVSADLAAIATTPIVIVCSGVKSILDVGATLERLETLGVPVVGYRTDRFAGFYLRDAGYPVPWTVDSPTQIASIHRSQRVLAAPAGVVVANPVPEADQLDPVLHDRVLQDGLARAAAHGFSGAGLTPFLLDHFHRATGGRSLDVNVTLILRNAALAAATAVALAV